MGPQSYSVQIERAQDGLHVRSHVRGFALELGAHRADPDAGFNPVETLLSAIGACFSTSFGMVADLSGVRVERLRMALHAVRQDRPPRITEIRYTAFIQAEADDAKVERLVALAERNSTVIGTLRTALPISGEWKRYGASADWNTEDER